MSLPPSRVTLRRWCGTCGKVTESWIDAYQEERCSGCDPEDSLTPGYGLADTADDDEWVTDDDDDEPGT